MLHSQRTTDICEHASALPGWRQRYDQLSRGRLDGWLAVAEVHGVQVFHERLNQRVVQHMRLPSGAVNILLPLAWPQVEAHGDISALHPSLLPADGELRVVSPAGMDVLCMSVPAALLRGLVDDTCLDQALKCNVPRRLRLSALQRQQGVQALGLAMQHASTPAGQSLETQRRLLALALDWLVSQDDQWSPLSRPSTREYMVERCHQWLLEQPDHSPSVLELCRRLKVSRRTLQYSFQSIADATPVQYMRSVRLNGARRTLREEPSACIAEIAERWGFGHSSYFALEYQKLFAELPSELQRSGA